MRPPFNPDLLQPCSSLQSLPVVYSSLCCAPRLSFDGFRCQLHKAGGDIVKFSNNGRDFTNRFPGIRDAVNTMPCKSAVIDGEVVACRQDGTPDYTSATTLKRSSVSGPLTSWNSMVDGDP